MTELELKKIQHTIFPQKYRHLYISLQHMVSSATFGVKLLTAVYLEQISRVQHIPQYYPELTL